MNPKPVFLQPLRTIQLTLVILWLYQGLIPKILFQSPAEISIWQNMGFELALAKVLVGLSGGCEMLFGLCFLKWNRSILLHGLNIIGWITTADCIHSPVATYCGIQSCGNEYRHADAFCSGHSTHPRGTTGST